MYWKKQKNLSKARTNVRFVNIWKLNESFQILLVQLRTWKLVNRLRYFCSFLNYYLERGRIKPTSFDNSAIQTVFSWQLLERIIQTTEVRIKMKTTIIWIISKLADPKHLRQHTLQRGRSSLAALQTISLGRFWETRLGCFCILSETVRLKFIFVHLEMPWTKFRSWQNHTRIDLKKLRSTTFRKQL